ncbi:dipeptidase [Consotaella salsifontis]|uniref:Dipeptidase AC. Metallo peptidase. MEROPS family M19 n=1 Tax=Consotaella salsifontis TaxID=1365950 RepID=A0A1T4L2E6_9HYPH|nr:dipeptidase [Consotaella salsifontis]SJZ48710.1 dipeptidase AC. Metallo peptidase. MEROPS family M19 [Consotaella salsifontis]
MPSPIVFDGHNDVLLRIMEEGTPRAFETFLNGGAGGHIDLKRAETGGLRGGMFAIFPPSPHEADVTSRMPKGGYALPLPVPLEKAVAEVSTVHMASILFRLERMSKGRLKVCRSVADIEAAWAVGAMAAVLHIEGAEALDEDLKLLDVLHAAGLRSIGMVWSRNNIFADGVPMAFPSSPDVGGGLKEPGKRLVERCNELGILLDLSHLNEKGFWDVAELSNAPLVATHSNAHALCPVSRNLTDSQLDAIAASKGVVGLNFATAFLREDGSMDDNTPLETMLRHLDHLLGRLGEDGVALGSDFDGAMIPRAIKDAAGLPALFSAMESRGYGSDLIEKIAHKNWLGVLGRTWKTAA